MTMVRDKLMQMFKKGISLIECFTEVKTVDGFVLRVFAMGFTCRSWHQINKNAKAGANKKREIRARMVSEIQNKCSGKKLSEVMSLIKNDTLDKDLLTELKKIRPMNNVCVRKVRVIRRPKVDLKELMTLKHT
jgi:small subunit ribosomal protein S3Ae